MNEPSDSKFVTRKWNIVNDQSNKKYDEGSEIICDAEVLKSNVCDYNDTYILVKGDITVTTTSTAQVSFKHCAPFTKNIIKLDRKTIDNAEDLDLVMPMYNLMQYSSNCSQTGGFWFYSKDERANFNNNIEHTDNFISLKYKAKLLGNTVTQPALNNANGILKNATIIVPLKYLCNFWRSLEVLLINCKFELKLKWEKHCVLSEAGNNYTNAKPHNIILTIKDIKLYLCRHFTSKR